LAAFAWSPLVLIEIISNMHNDLWMMGLAILGLGLIARQRQNLPTIVLSLILLGASISIKLATAVLIPIWLLLLLRKWVPTRWLDLVNRFWPLAASILLFVPLLTARSQQFHPWYLVWPLVWLPLMGDLTQSGQLRMSKIERIWITWLIALSVSAMFRYIPWLLTGYFTSEVFWQQKLITWLPAVVVTGLWLLASPFFQKVARPRT
jgi:hypothetical protein